MNANVLSVLKARAAARIGRRPTWSDARPASSSATRTPAAYVAKISVTIPEEKWNRDW
jgi:hypothetical protein